VGHLRSLLAVRRRASSWGCFIPVVRDHHPGG
jgi:hypothetical protein